MFVVEAIHDTVVTDAEGKQQVTLRITAVEPVPSELEDKIREFQRALYRNRPDVLGQEVLKGTASIGPTPDAALDVAVDATAEWDGSTEGPLTLVQGPYCPAPGCGLLEDHDGDHDTPEDDEPDED